MAPVYGSVNSIMLRADVSLRIGMFLFAFGVDSMSRVLHYLAIPSTNHEYITRSHMCYHGNVEECGKPQGSRTKYTNWLPATCPTCVNYHLQLQHYLCSPIHPPKRNFDTSSIVNRYQCCAILLTYYRAYIWLCSEIHITPTSCQLVLCRWLGFPIH